MRQDRTAPHRQGGASALINMSPPQRLRSVLVVFVHVSAILAGASAAAATQTTDDNVHDNTCPVSSLRPPTIVVVGSLNVDITVRVPRPPAKDETMVASVRRRSGGVQVEHIKVDPVRVDTASHW